MELLEGETGEEFEQRMRDGFEGDNSAEAIDSGIIVPFVPESCSDETQ
jgi:hypothetical protein